MTRLNTDAFFFDLEIFGAIEFDPVGDGVLAGVAEFDVFGYEVAESGWEFDFGFWNVVG